MGSRVRKPETVTLPVFGDETVTVKKWLNAGETRAVLQRCFAPGATEPDPLRHGWSQAIAYLLDWSITDAVILDQPPEFIGAALDALDPEDFLEIAHAIDQHDDAMKALRAAEKNAQRGGRPLPATSPSLVTTAGAMSGSLSSTPMSTL